MLLYYASIACYGSSEHSLHKQLQTVYKPACTPDARLDLQAKVAETPRIVILNVENIQ